MLKKIDARLRDSGSLIEEHRKKAQPYLDDITALFADELERSKAFVKDFSQQNWALRQAYAEGLKEGLTKLSKYVIIEDVNK